jgi:hypothetical protein
MPSISHIKPPRHIYTRARHLCPWVRADSTERVAGALTSFRLRWLAQRCGGAPWSSSSMAAAESCSNQRMRILMTLDHSHLPQSVKPVKPTFRSVRSMIGPWLLPCNTTNEVRGSRGVANGS